MGLYQNENKTYLNISYGKFRHKTDENDPQKKTRETKEGKTIHERVYDGLKGRIVGVYYKEDEKFGNSFEVTLQDGEDKFQVSFKEGDNFFNDFFSKLPNLDTKKEVKLVPYSFEAEGKSRRGLTVWQDGAKVDSYFVRKIDGEYRYAHGFPQPEGQMDKDEWTIYFVKVTKFLRNYIKQEIIPSLSKSDSVPDSDNDDLPF